MDEVKKNKYISLTILGVFFACFLIFKAYDYVKNKNELKDSVIVVAEIERLEYTRASTTVVVQYHYNGQLINNSFSTYDLDSLKVKTKVKLLIPRKQPSSRYIKFVGVENQ